MKINSVRDPNFLKLGSFLVLFGLLVLVGSFIFQFSWVIALKPGGLGLLIVLVHFLARLIKK